MFVFIKKNFEDSFTFDMNQLAYLITFKLFILFANNFMAKCDYWEYKLMNDLLDDYDSSIRPSVNHNTTLNVTFGLALAQIIDVVSFIFFSFKEHH